MNIENNDIVDKVAKETARTKGEDARVPITIHNPLKSSRSVVIKRAIHQAWNPHGRIRNMTPSNYAASPTSQTQHEAPNSTKLSPAGVKQPYSLGFGLAIVR